MSNWELQYSQSGSLVDVDVGIRNVTGAPLISAVRIADRAPGSNVTVSGVFRFTLQGTTTVSVEVLHYGDMNSPELFEGTRTVVSDGVTANLSLVPGLSVILSSSAVMSDVFEIGVGCYWDSVTLAWVRALPFDFVVANGTSAERTLYAMNGTGSVQCNTQLVVTNAARCENGQTASRPFWAFRQTGLLNPSADLDLLGRAVTFTNLVEGTPNTVTLLVDGTGLDVYDVTNDATLAGGVGLNCDEITVYRFSDTTELCSCEFVLSTSVVETDAATIFVSDGGDFVETSDTATAFTAGTAPIYLTTLNAPEGAVAVDDAIPFKVKLVCPSGKTAALNQRLFSIRVQSEGV